MKTRFEYSTFMTVWFPHRHQWHPNLPIWPTVWNNWWHRGAQTEVCHFMLCHIFSNTNWHFSGTLYQEVDWNNKGMSVVVTPSASITSGTCVWMEITWARPSLWMSSCASDTSALLFCRKVVPNRPGGIHAHTHAHIHTRTQQQTMLVEAQVHTLELQTHVNCFWGSSF